MKKLLLLTLLGLGIASPVCAASGPGYLKLSLWDSISFAIPNNIQQVEGVDVGIGSHTHRVTGLQWDLMWAETNYLTGASLAFGISKTSRAEGLQWAFVNMADHITGAQLGGWNTTTDMTGAQVGGVNMSVRSIVGAQVGFYNQAEYINGVQFGFVNYAKYIYGLQLGIFNIAENGYLPAMVFINGRF